MRTDQLNEFTVRDQSHPSFVFENFNTLYSVYVNTQLTPIVESLTSFVSIPTTVEVSPAPLTYYSITDFDVAVSCPPTEINSESVGSESF